MYSSTAPAASLPRLTNGRTRLSASRVTFTNYVAAATAVAITTAIATPLLHYFDLVNIVMLYPLTVLLVALRLGRGPAVMAAFLSVALFDFFLVPPRFSFAVADVQYLLTFAVMLGVALVTAHLAAGLRQQAQAAALKEERSRALYEMARELARADTLERIAEIVRGYIANVLEAPSALLLRDEKGELMPLGGNVAGLHIDREMARIAYANAGFTDIDGARPLRYYQIKTGTGVSGVLAVGAPGSGAAFLVDHDELLDALASVAAIAMDRVRDGAALRREQAQPSLQRLQRAYSTLLFNEIASASNALEQLQQAAENAQANAALPEEWEGLPTELRSNLVQLRCMVARLGDEARSNKGSR
jgi:two-component system, OmpR family, sensor histidine kinase KdpD